MDTENKDVPLGRDYQDDIGEESLGTEHIAGVPTDPVDRIETRTRSSDYESLPRARIGGENELSLDRVNLDSGGSLSGGGSGADWESNMSTRAGSTALDSPNAYVGSSLVDVSSTGDHEDVPEEVSEELRDADVKLGIASLNMDSVGLALANARWMANQRRYAAEPEWKRQQRYAKRREERANRAFDKARADSTHRRYLKEYKKFIDDRTAADPRWHFDDPIEIERMDGIDSRSARVIAERWRREQDIKTLQSSAVKYAGLTEGIRPVSVRARWKKQPHLRDLAEFVFVQDCIACGVISPGGFDREQLLSEHGDELITMNTACSERDRRVFIIENAAEMYSAGTMLPPYCWDDLTETLNRVVELIEIHAPDLLEIEQEEEEVDWSRV